MVFDALGPEIIDQLEGNIEEPPNREAKKFYDLLHSSQRPLWEGCVSHSELSMVVKMLTIKAEGNISQQSFNDTLQAMKEGMPKDNLLVPNNYKAKKLVSKLGMGSEKIDCCIEGCMLYYKDDLLLKECRFCHAPRYKVCKDGKEVPFQRMHYLPLIPRLKRLYASKNSAHHMTWHYKHQQEKGVLEHPSDADAWKHFDQTYPQFSSEPRNVRLGLCSDGFNPFGQSGKQYSCWPIIVTPYNLPPWMCMTTPYLFLTMIIPGPRNPKSKIDVYLQPLIDELKLLWEDGALTYDISKKQNFVMRAALMWTVNDFPAYAMLSGWMTAGKLACPYCMEHSKAFHLKNGGKTSWFDCHRQFLPKNHVFRRNKDQFIKDRVERSEPPPRLTGEEIWERVHMIPRITDVAEIHMSGYGIEHHWTKQSIFWDLPYWSTNLVRHNLDVMHIEKNVFDNVFNTVMDIKGRTKDNVKARKDLKEVCKSRGLELQEQSNGKMKKPKANYTFTLEQKREVCEWVKGLKMPDGYASNMARCVDMKEGKLHGMKSHDCHVFMERLLPIAFNSLPEQI
jgi:predicted amino acid-binding ACT domain protein